jgi:hypothetical protein
VLRLQLLQLVAYVRVALRGLPQLALQLAATLLPGGQLLRQLLNLQHSHEYNLTRSVPRVPSMDMDMDDAKRRKCRATA